MRFFFVAAILLAAASSAAAEPELGLSVGRAFDSQETDIVRLTYRRPLAERDGSWWPQQVQLGTTLWRVPDLGGITRRFDVNATPIWRTERGRGYFEGGLGLYILSATINNDTNRLPSSVQFGSHLGAGIRVGERGSIGVAVQHISNAGLKQPNGGINFYMVTASFPL
jgi:lipid A 3-O-deacylase PagL